MKVNEVDNLLNIKSDVISPEELKDVWNVFLIRHGNKYVNSNILELFKNEGTQKATETIRSMIKTMYLGKWEKFVKLLISTDDPLLVSRETFTSNNKSNRGMTNKVSAYDSPTMVDDTATVNNDSTDISTERVKRSTAFLSKNLSALNKNTLYDTMTLDLKNLLLVSIY